MAPEISHILFTYSDFMFLLYLRVLILCFFLYLPILKVSCVYLKWLKSLNLEGPSLCCPKFCQILSLLHNCLRILNF